VDSFSCAKRRSTVIWNSLFANEISHISSAITSPKSSMSLISRLLRTSISGVIRKEKIQSEELRPNQSKISIPKFIFIFTRKPVSPPKQNRRSNQKKEENLKTRSGRRVKVPQLDGNADSSDESSSRSGMEVDLPQTDGANDAQRIPAQQLPLMYQQMPPNQQQHTHNGNTHTRPTVIPILMPPGNW
jgi:hypothetical protein